MKVTIYAHGKMSEAFYGDACAAYEKRLSTLWPLTILEAPEARLPQNPSQAQIDAALQTEAKAALSKIPRRAYVIALCIEGKMLDSPGLCRVMEEAALSGCGEIWFLIGSSHGLAPELKQRADLRLSISPMTFPHQLARVILCEQIYRAAQIAKGTPYHK